MRDECLLRFPFSPLQASLAAKFGTGVISTSVPGGPSLMRLDTTGNVHTVSASWNLRPADYDMFMGYVRNWERSGGDPFLISLRLEGSESQEYRATFIPGSFSRPTRSAGVFTVEAQLEVLPNFVSPCNDEWAARALMEAVFGDDVCEAIDILDKVVNEDLVYVRA